ncbi:hypothetical protein FA13DRAFT_1049186 [Coprinellus micaceus]|uniref:Uncharacterized protein n=1 Tax=Coprinellus micaceus TaxID=71717 RepID=A0A4Y7RLV6_COPMI|nr:hypothetical protein FA13DRAFT_1049186 [Coprinellus micaceus]
MQTHLSIQMPLFQKRASHHIQQPDFFFLAVKPCGHVGGKSPNLYRLCAPIRSIKARHPMLKLDQKHGPPAPSPAATNSCAYASDALSPTWPTQLKFSCMML